MRNLLAGFLGGHKAEATIDRKDLQISNLRGINNSLIIALTHVADGTWDDVDPDDGLAKNSVRAYARRIIDAAIPLTTPRSAS